MTKIYCVYNDSNDSIYIGSTNCMYISTRLAQHNYNYRKYKLNPTRLRYSSDKVIEDKNGVFNKTNITLLDECNEDIRYYTENYWINYYKTLGFDVVNENSPITTKEIIACRSKRYYENNKSKILEKYKKKRTDIK